MSDSHVVEELEPKDAFAILSDETRIEILRALWGADEQEATFSELRDAVGMRDSGKFNYHLGKLTGRFVGKTDEGYELRPAGQHVVGSLLAGGYTMTADFEPIDLEDPCPACAGTMTFDYEHERVFVSCTECAFTVELPVPPGAFAGYESERFPSVADRYIWSLVGHVRNGFCPMCDGDVRSTLLTPAELSDELPAAFADVVTIRYDCERCEASTQLDIGTTYLDHPAVVSFHYEHDIDVRELPVWGRTTTPVETQSHLLEGDPARATVTYAVDDASLTLTVDDALEVVAVDRCDGC